MAGEIGHVSKRVRRVLEVTKLPYITKVYINYQVLIPASLVRSLGIESAEYANIVLEHEGQEVVLKHAKLLRTRNTASRQFTIPREVREKYGIKPLDEVKIISIEPSKGGDEE